MAKIMYGNYNDLPWMPNHKKDVDGKVMCYMKCFAMEAANMHMCIGKMYNGMAIGGFVLACVSLVLCCLPITAIVGLVLSIISMPQIDQRGERGKGLAVAGIVLNALVVLGWLLMFIISLMGSMAY